jgi:hypothetical protein
MSCTLTLCFLAAIELAHPPAAAEAHRFTWEPLSKATTIADSDAFAVLAHLNRATMTSSTRSQPGSWTNAVPTVEVRLLNPVQGMAEPVIDLADVPAWAASWVNGVGKSDDWSALRVAPWALPGPTFADIRQEPRDSPIFLAAWPAETP